MTDEHDVEFPAMGSTVRLVIGKPVRDAPPAEVAADEVRKFVEHFEVVLSRFRPDSELCVLNADPREAVPASELMRTAVSAGIWAADRSGGLVDPGLLDEIEAAGYAETPGEPAVPLASALAVAPRRCPARPRPDSDRHRFEVDEDAGTVRRPNGVHFDSGGIGKGLAADLIARRLVGYARFVVDCGGDIRVGGNDALLHPYEIVVEHPLSGERTHAIRLGFGGIATSGLNVRIWRAADGTYRHHLLDPSTGEPAWTGLIGATALGDTALEAETLAKAALLSGPEGGRSILAEIGGLMVHDDGRVETIGPISVRAL
jgi:thiamine biosynthesis lipoprotein